MAVKKQFFFLARSPWPWGKEKLLLVTVGGSDVNYRCGIGLSLHTRQLKLTEVLGGAD